MKSGPCCAATLIAGVLAAAGAAEPWPQFRGPRADGTSVERLGDRWRLLWKTAIAGTGHSSPSVVNGRLFITSFERESSTLRQLAGFRGRLYVVALDTRTGRELWKREVPADEIEKTTSVNTPATPTPAADGEGVYAYFGSLGVQAFTHAGQPTWTLKIGPHPNHMGAGSSPVLASGSLYVNAETDGPSALYAIDTKSGAARWSSPRRTRQAGYASPVVWGDLIVVAGHHGVTAYSARDGREAWTVAGLSDYVVPTPVARDSLLYATSSGPGGNALLALRPSGETVWTASRGAAYVASPVIARGGLVTINSNCVVSLVDAAKGNLLRQARLSNMGECYASPVASPGRVLVSGTSGMLLSLDDTTLEVRQQLQTGDSMIASPAISGGVVYLRGAHSVAAYSAAAALQ